MTNVNEFSIWEAVRGEGVVPFAQPIVALGGVGRDSPNLSFEILARLWDGNKFLPPGNFFYAIEGTPLMALCDQKILLAAIQQVAHWKRSLGLDVHVHVNACQETLCDPSYSAYVEKLLGEYGVSPQQLTVEVLETCNSFWKSAAIRRTLSSLASLEVGIAIDDICPKWHDLRGLLNWIESAEKSIPISAIKIDRGLVRIACDPGETKIQQESRISAIQKIIRYCEVARNRGINVIAEGVEKPGDLPFMHQLGCNYVQGYLLGKPQAMADTTKALAKFYKDEFHPAVALVTESQRQVTASH